MIKVEDLMFTYHDATAPTVKGISFEVEKGEIFGFLGPSGAGKSTTQKILIKILSNFSGSVKILGKELQKWGKGYYNHIGVGFELPNHYLKLTAVENLQFFSSFYDKPTADPLDLLQMVGLAEDANKKVGEFSKGMKMRLNFIRSFMHDPDIVFLDEPTSGLDPVNAKIIKDIIRNLKSKNKTIFITTHNMYDAEELCDRVAFINNGEISLIDSPKSLKLKEGKRLLHIEYENGTIFQETFSLDNLGNNQDFIELIKKYKVQSLHSEEASLNDIFIKVTGKSLEH